MIVNPDLKQRGGLPNRYLRVVANGAWDFRRPLRFPSQSLLYDPGLEGVKPFLLLVRQFVDHEQQHLKRVGDLRPAARCLVSIVPPRFRRSDVRYSHQLDGGTGGEGICVQSPLHAKHPVD